MKQRRAGRIGANDRMLSLVSGSGLNYLNATEAWGRMTGPLALDEVKHSIHSRSFRRPRESR